MTDWFKNNASIVWSWTGLIAVAAIVFAVSRGTGYHQLGVGLLAASLALLVAMALFEVIWQLIVKWLDSPNDKNAPKSAPKTRRRGQ